MCGILGRFCFERQYPDATVWRRLVALLNRFVLCPAGNGELAFAKLGKNSKLVPDPGANADNLFK